ncbi:MAG: AraC family transcriptional regulator [Flavobacterium psychrophilum]|uniref:chromate resistance protein ChrB domain-containing protein n=1 Tax=Elizabethkingia sp. 2-6 TaxID=2575699 RepID=UPI000DB73C3E|nr:chromate resistance protein ChrB domain-containing protein [Elizabethkingia sp. 2-6]PZR06406.1 MAG: AraC family transcriptional regulator [Flavobacterium psychrophilum]QCO45437.1 helix-turn-helix domain-containing protein [Elizabethkingia sp. 2-6]
MKWITRERPKIDRLACPWLIKRFIDKEAEFIYVPYNQVLSLAEDLGAIPFDITGAEYTHYDDLCTFDYIIKKHKIEDPGVIAMSSIVRGADTDRHDLAPQASGLWAISAGMAYNEPNDQLLLEKAMVLYDALHSWAKNLQDVKHGQQPFESQFIEILKKFKEYQKNSQKTPEWVKELKEIIQDQIDTNLSQRELSKELDISPSYLSRIFSKYFENMSFGEYVRKQRIENAKKLMCSTSYSLTEIAFLSGFSDQSHFARIFKKETGFNPSEYRKKNSKR